MWSSKALPWAPTAADTSALSVSCSLSPFTHLPCISIPFFLSAFSTISLLCLAHGLLPQFSVKLEFEINLSLSPLTCFSFFLCPCFFSSEYVFPLSATLLFTFLLDFTSPSLPSVSSVLWFCCLLSYATFLASHVVCCFSFASTFLQLSHTQTREGAFVCPFTLETN